MCDRDRETENVKERGGRGRKSESLLHRGTSVKIRKHFEGACSLLQWAPGIKLRKSSFLASPLPTEPSHQLEFWIPVLNRPVHKLFRYRGNQTYSPTFPSSCSPIFPSTHTPCSCSFLEVVQAGFSAYHCHFLAAALSQGCETEITPGFWNELFDRGLSVSCFQ